MKKFATTLFLLATAQLTISAQIRPVNASMSEGARPGFEFDVNGDNKTAEKIWKDYTKSAGKLNWDRRNKEHQIIGGRIPTIDALNPITIIAKFEDFKKITRVKVWLKSNDVFLTEEEHPDQINGAKLYFNEFITQVEKSFVGDELKEEQKNLDKLEKDLEKLVKQNEGFHKDIEKAKDAIQKAERAIDENNKNQKEKQKEIKAQQEKVSEVADKLKKVGT